MVYKIISLYFYLILLFHPHLSCSSQATNTSKVKISRGVYTRESLTPTFYTSVGALTFEYQLPNFSSHRSMIYDQDCPTDEILDNQASSSYTCPIFHYLHKIRDELEPLIQLKNLQSLPAADNGYQIPQCPNLSKHFLSVKVTSENLESYKAQLHQCVNGLMVKSASKLDFNQSLFRFPYAFMMSNFLDSYFKQLPSEGRTDLAVLLNAATNYNTLAFLQGLAEAQRWQDAVKDCQNQNIPKSLISPEVLSSSLQKLNELLLPKQLEPITSVNSSLGVYYRDKLTDCTFTDDNKLFIRVLVPLKQSSTNWKYLEVKSVPFLEVKSKRICYIKEFEEGKHFALDLLSRRNVQIECAGVDSEPGGNNQDERFCFLREEEQSISAFKKTCASTVLAAENRRSVLAKFCPMLCEEAEFFNLPIFTRVAPDRFVIVGMNESLVAEIDSSVNIIELGGSGALEVTLPCKGVIMFGKRRFQAEEPCGRVYKVVRVEPVQWGEAHRITKEMLF
ncbi:unnamed protein product [Allacma fusca]|uniref:Uncharacterized protein n=1 Tax=Allacma fusca TaxID=39272 RepID=A0A8J2NWF5_9HEXA|nr:unnamed protein product [Allacma fusca]